MRKYAFVCVLAIIFTIGCRKPPEPLLEHIEISVPYDPETLDPHTRNTISNFAVASNFYEPLVRTDAHLKIQPALARRWENPDLLTWEFELQPLVKFHSGKTLTAADVVYSFRRLLDNPELEMRSYLSNISEVTAIDPHHIRIRTRRPVSVFLNRLNFILIIPEGSSGDSLAKTVNGTGAYRFVRWEKGANLTMRQFENYRAKKAVFRLVTLHLNRTAQQAMEDVKAGACHMAQSNIRDLEPFVKTSDKYLLLVHDSLFTRYLGYDLKREVAPHCSAPANPFRDKRVRQAIRMAIDLKRLTSRLSSYALPATQLVPPFVFGFNPSIPSAENDPARARALLAQAGFPHGFSVTLNARKTLIEAATEVKTQLREVGIEIEINALSSGDFYDALDRKDFAFFLTGLGCPTGDASTVLEDAIHTYDPKSQMGDSNFAGYSNPEVDRMIEESSSIAVEDARKRAFQQIMAMVMSDLPWIPLYVDQEAYVLDKKLLWEPRNDSYLFAYEIGLRKPL